MQGDSTANLNEKRAPGTATHSRKKLYIILGSIIGALVVLGAVLGGVLASKNNSNNDKKSGSGSASDASPITTTLPNGQATTITPTPASTSTPKASVSPLPTYDWTRSSLAGALAEVEAGATNVQAPMMGVALGSWLILVCLVNLIDQLVILTISSKPTGTMDGRALVQCECKQQCIRR